MALPDRRVIDAMRDAPPPPKDQSWQEQREGFAAFAASIPKGEYFYSATSAKLGGIEGEWIKPAVVRPGSAMLYLHGGGYTIGAARHHRILTSALATGSGFALFAPDYRLAPEFPFPAGIEDAVAAYRGMLDLGFGYDQIAIAGDSAGAGLVISTLLAARDQGLPMPACAVAMSPWCDLTLTSQAFVERAQRDPLVDAAATHRMAQAYLQGTDARTPLASPIFADLAGLPPLLIQVGSEEMLYDDAMALNQAADRAGVEVSFECWGGMVHVWQFFHTVLPEGRDAIDRIIRFVQERIGPSATTSA